MSKSLKNFITTSEALKRPEWTSRSLRICFLLGAWHDKLEITEDILKAAAGWESKINNFFLNAIHITSSSHGVEGSNSPQDEVQSLPSLEKAKTGLHEALCDSFDTPTAMRIISDFVSECNTTELSRAATLSASRWITRIVTIFGLNPEGENVVLGPNGDVDFSSQPIAWHGVEIPLAAQPPIDAASKLRDDIRRHVLSAKENLDYDALRKLTVHANSTLQPSAAADADQYHTTASQFRADLQHLISDHASQKEILGLCDDFRDTHLYSLDIYLEDREDLPALVRPLDISLRRALAEKRALATAGAAEKAKRRAEDAKKQLARDEQAKIPPAELFRNNELYSEWDEQGIPIRDAKGDEVTKSSRKKLVKLYEKQQKVHGEWLSKTKRE